MLARSPATVPVSNSPRPSSAPSIHGKTRLETCVQAMNRSGWGCMSSPVLHTNCRFGDYSPGFFSEDEGGHSVCLVDLMEAPKSESTFNNGSPSSGILQQFTRGEGRGKLRLPGSDPLWLNAKPTEKAHVQGACRRNRFHSPLPVGRTAAAGACACAGSVSVSSLVYKKIAPRIISILRIWGSQTRYGCATELNLRSCQRA